MYNYSIRIEQKKYNQRGKEILKIEIVIKGEGKKKDGAVFIYFIIDLKPCGGTRQTCQRELGA